MKKTATALAFLLLAGAAGCPPSDQPTVHNTIADAPPRELDEIVNAINDNAAKLDRAMWCGAVHVVAHLVDSKRKEHTYNFDGKLLYQFPRSLWLDLRHGLGDPVMQVGSNDEEYWAWIVPEMEQMWWGRHRNAGKPCVQKIAVRPEHMVAALGVSALPKSADGLIGPIRAYGREYDILYYASIEPDGGYRFARQYYVERSAPFQVRLITFLDKFGQKEMSAFLDNYRPTWDGGPLVAHDVSIFWPKENGKLTVKMDRVIGKDASEVSSGAFLRPADSQVPARVRNNIEQIDAQCDASNSGD